LASEIHVSTVVAPKPLNEFEALKREAMKAASETDDAYIQGWIGFVIGWEEFHRGRMNHGRDAARKLRQVGRQLDDPRSTGLGLVLLSMISLVSAAFAEALEYSEQALAAAVTPFDRTMAVNAKGNALAGLRRGDEGAKLLEENNRRCVANGDLHQLDTSAPAVAVCKILQGNIGAGIRCLEEQISTREKEDYRALAHWAGYFLSEVYLEIIGSGEKLPFLTLLRNLPTLLKVRATASWRIREVVARFLEEPRFDPDAWCPGCGHRRLGLLYKAKKQRALAIQHLTDARRYLSPFGQTPQLARVDAALAELGLTAAHSV
jgi:hypothetical protein